MAIQNRYKPASSFILLIVLLRYLCCDFNCFVGDETLNIGMNLFQHGLSDTRRVFFKVYINNIYRRKPLVNKCDNMYSITFPYAWTDPEGGGGAGGPDPPPLELPDY